MIARRDGVLVVIRAWSHAGWAQTRKIAGSDFDIAPATAASTPGREGGHKKARPSPAGPGCIRVRRAPCAPTRHSMQDRVRDRAGVGVVRPAGLLGEGARAHRHVRRTARLARRDPGALVRYLGTGAVIGPATRRI